VIVGRDARARYADAYHRAVREKLPGGNNGGCYLSSDARLPYIHGQYVRLASDVERSK
jgi:hypothetical protein